MIESMTEAQSTDAVTLNATAGTAGRLKVPVFGDVEARIAGAVSHGNEHRDQRQQRVVTEQQYTEAYYLYLVQGALRASGLLKQVRTLSDARTLKIGDFVEYEAHFDADHVSAALDILTPELVAEITRYATKKRWLAGIDWEDYGTRTGQLAQMAEEINQRVPLAEAITKAMRADFRSEKTREYFGRIGTGQGRVTAITICDTAHFVIDDQDRILDGSFKVLGKVTDGVVKDRPILERNKILDKVTPEAVDHMIDSANSSMSRGAQVIEGAVSSEAPASPVDLRLESRIAGQSFKVIPIAVYA